MAGFIALLCVSILVCFVLWRILLVFFMAGFGSFAPSRYGVIVHFLCLCLYVFFAYILALWRVNLGMPFWSMQVFSFEQDMRIYSSLVCAFLLLHVLSVLDWHTQRVPNILLVLLFSCVFGLWVLLYDDTSYPLMGYPFTILGAVYGVYFLIHIIGHKRLIGEGDVWIIASLAICLESLFSNALLSLFELLCCASLLGICLHYYKTWQIASTKARRLTLLDSHTKPLTSNLCESQSQTISIPFIPCLSVSFFCVSAWHAA